MRPIPEQLEVIKRGTVELIEEAELVAKLQKGAPLRVKAGFDPTAPDLHLGHTVLLNKLKQFQDLGHQVIFLVGDFTAQIGDPTGRSEARPPLSKEAVMENAKTYQEQAFKILDKSKTEIRFNGEWLESMSAMEWARLGAKQTVARMLERDDFKKRFKENRDISILEFYYPLLQAHDSVALKADVEIGGTDQKFNLLMGRTIQKRSNMATQVVLTLPILEGTDGVLKMSKSAGNYIGIKEAPKDMFGKVMSISDELMWRYYELVSSKGLDEIRSLEKAVKEGSLHPKKAKEELARDIVTRFHSSDAADAAMAEFNTIFAQGGMPAEIEEAFFAAGSGKKSLAALLTEAGLTKSNSDAKRMIAQDAVQLNREKIKDPLFEIEAKGEYLAQVGKRRFKKLIFK